MERHTIILINMRLKTSQQRGSQVVFTLIDDSRGLGCQPIHVGVILCVHIENSVHIDAAELVVKDLCGVSLSSIVP